MTKPALSGRAIGEAYLAQVQDWLNSGKPIPARDGDLDMTAIAAATGVPRQSLYKNPAIRALLDSARSRVAEQARPDSSEAGKPDIQEEPSATKEAKLERRVHRLEQQNAALVAENCELRRQVKQLQLQLGRQDMMLESGRRVVSPE